MLCGCTRIGRDRFAQIRDYVYGRLTLATRQTFAVFHRSSRGALLSRYDARSQVRALATILACLDRCSSGSAKNLSRATDSSGRSPRWTTFRGNISWGPKSTFTASTKRSPRHPNRTDMPQRQQCAAPLVGLLRIPSWQLRKAATGLPGMILRCSSRRKQIMASTFSLRP